MSAPGGVVSPSRQDPVVRAASQLVGGPAGRRLASATGFWRAVPILVLMAVAVLGAGVVQKQHCRAQGWTTPDQFWHACYSDVPVLFGSHALGGGSDGTERPDLADAVGPGGLGQPPLASAAMWLVSSVVSGEGPRPARQFFDVSTLALALALAVAVTAVAAAAGRRRWDAAHVALAPILVTAGLISYQLLGVALLALALLAWRRQRGVLGGVLLGLAAAASPTVVVGVVAVAVLVTALGSARAVTRAGLALVATTAVTWLGVRVLLLPGLSGSLPSLWEDWRSSPPGYGSLWLAPQLMQAARPQRQRWWWPFEGASALGGTTASALSLITTAVVLAIIVVLVARRPQPLPAARVALAMMAAVLVLGTSLPVQVSLLLLPLVALAGLRWRDHLIWAATECVYFVGVWLYIGAQSDANRGLPAGFYLVMLLARLAGIGWLGVQALRPPPDLVPADVEAPPEPRDSSLTQADSYLWTAVSEVPGRRAR